MLKTGIIKDPLYLEHTADDYHPESPHRLETIYSMLEEKDMAGKFVAIKPREATREELGYIHTAEYISRVASTKTRSKVMLDPDTYTSPGSWEAAILAAGGVLELIDNLMEKKIDNGFAFLRPPGHHAEADRAMGFCLFNNIAIGAKYAIEKYNLDRILIIDWDIHHGNGTQRSFYNDPQVLYFSTHQYPYYPGTGGVNELGEGKGKGFTINIPLSSGVGDDEYAGIFMEILKPVAFEFKPQLILVSAGFDIYIDDPLGGMEITPEGFARLAKIILELADTICEGKVLFILEGGYSLKGLHDSVKAVLLELSGESALFKGRTLINENINTDGIFSKIEQIKTAIKPYWPGLF
ncbi:histone deacetylase family protein [Desulfobacterium sp. N47]